MRLVKFQVQNFRSVTDSGWIETSDVTALIGTNESGKTNLLMPLWKLNPAGKDGGVNLLSDAPRLQYNIIRDAEKKPIFIRTIFELGDAEAESVSKITGRPRDDVRIASVDRDLSGQYYIGFPDDQPARTTTASILREILATGRAEIDAMTALKSEELLKVRILGTIEAALALIPESKVLVTADDVKATADTLRAVSTEGAPKTSSIAPRFARIIQELDAAHAPLTIAAAHSNADARTWVLNHLPKFVYYSNYGNLDSEIYLPHVLENIERADELGAKESAKARTLKVLFDFVTLSPQEILELGREFKGAVGQQPTPEQIAEIAERKKEREVLLTSASSSLTSRFRGWWKQGEYRFRFNADGDHFRIWVSDDKRPEEIELENRSTGLQWFLSFYLIFLVESQDAHAGAILLLDEPGLSLHPLAQRDLSEFFASLAEKNQLLYTTHSPFLVDPDHLDRVKAVFVKDDGTTGVSSDLRAGEKDRQQKKSIYPVHAALGLSVSDIILSGAQPVIVEGTSDQIYLSAIKVLLIAAGRIRPTRELIFVPAGGVRGIKALASILTAKDDSLPRVLVDADGAGAKLASELKTSLYADDQELVLDVAEYAEVDRAEIEDVLPANIVADVASRIVRSLDADDDFNDVYKAREAIVPQIEMYADVHKIPLALGWKVEIAKQVKMRLLKQGVGTVEEGVVDRWAALFNALLGSGADEILTNSNGNS